MTTAKLETAVRQEQIAQAALDIVSSNGLSGLSIAAIADRIGLVPSAIYRHFNGKEDVLDAVIELIHVRLTNNVAAIKEEISDPIERLRTLLMRHISMIKDNKGIPRIIFAEDVYESKPERKEKIYGNINGYLNSVSEILRDGQETGTIRKDIDSKALSVMFLGLVQPSAILWHFSNGVFDVLDQAKIAWRVFEDEIRVKESSPCCK